MVLLELYVALLLTLALLALGYIVFPLSWLGFAVCLAVVIVAPEAYGY